MSKFFSLLRSGRSVLEKRARDCQSVTVGTFLHPPPHLHSVNPRGFQESNTIAIFGSVELAVAMSATALTAANGRLQLIWHIHSGLGDVTPTIRVSRGKFVWGRGKEHTVVMVSALLYSLPSAVDTLLEPVVSQGQSRFCVICGQQESIPQKSSADVLHLWMPLCRRSQGVSSGWLNSLADIVAVRRATTARAAETSFMLSGSCRLMVRCDCSVRVTCWWLS